MHKGFTLIELVVVTAIIVLITALILPQYRFGDKSLALQRSAHKLSQDLRRTQEMAVSSQEFQGEVPAGYGIYLNRNQPTQYVLFADLDNDKNYDAGEQAEVLTLEKNIRIFSLSPGNPLTIVFSPPDPTISFSPDASTVSIVMRVASLQKSVEVNKAGLIYEK